MIHDAEPSERYVYDQTGNMIQRGTGSSASMPAGEAPGDRLERLGTTRYSYDSLGRLVQRTEKLPFGEEFSWEYTWNPLDQLTEVHGPDGQAWTYHYDALGRRIFKQGPRWRDSLRLGWRRYLSRTGRRCPPDLVSCPGSFVPLGTFQGREYYHVVTDCAGFPRELADLSGQVVLSMHFDAWGTMRSTRDLSEGKVRCPIRFQGQWIDEESGLHFNRFRYYDPVAARFISPDPARLKGGFNLYAYVPNPRGGSIR